MKNKKEIIHFFTKTIKRNILLPRNTLSLLSYIKKYPRKSINQIAEILVEENTYASLQVVRNYVTLLKKKNIITKSTTGKVKLTKYYE